MQRVFGSVVTILAIGFMPAALGQSNEELLKENQQLKARIKALEAAAPPKADDHDQRDERHKHGDHEEDSTADGDHGHGEWRWVDPFYPGWWLPTDEYRPYSWMPPPSEGFFHDLLFGQFIETHRSRGGTPWVHPFTIEPPQAHRDALVLYKYTNDADGGALDEHEAELHIDWALTRRLGFLLGVPYLGLRGTEEEATGFGDLEFGPRVVLVESDTFFLASNTLMTFPTGDEKRDLGRGEMTIAPFVTTWHDLGGLAPWTNWNTLYLNFGPEFALESGDKSLLYTVVYAHTILGPRILFPHAHGNGNGNGHAHGNGNGNSQQHGNGKSHRNDAHSNGETTGGTISVLGPHAPVGTTSFILEFNGQTELQGDRITLTQLLTGFAYTLTESAELRFAVDFPLNHRELQMDRQYTFGFMYMF